MIKTNDLFLKKQQVHNFNPAIEGCIDVILLIFFCHHTNFFESFQRDPNTTFLFKVFT